jgi:predicted glycosyltransferase
MKILIDIGHPAHVHYFRNFIGLMTRNGHQIQVTSRDKEVTFDLLRKYDIQFISRSKGGKGLFGKIFYILYADLKLIRVGLHLKPDILLSFASTYAAHASFILRKPHIAFDDTEHSKYEIFLYRPFTKVILNPQSFKKDFGKKQIRFKGFMELCYLHPKYFSPVNNVLIQLNLSESEPFVLLRFVSWTASHDMGETGFSSEAKFNLVRGLSKKIKVFISSENELPQDLEKLRLPVSPEKLHDVLYYSALYIGEGATTASECAMLGTPAIYVNSLSAGTLEEQERLGLLFGFRNSEGVLEKALEILNTPDFKARNRNRRDNMLEQTIDITEFMVWFIENYPESVKIMKENPDYQDRFR